MRSLLDSLDDALWQKVFSRLVLDVIRADGKLRPGESPRLWWALGRCKLSIPGAARAVSAPAQAAVVSGAAVGSRHCDGIVVTMALS